MSGRDERKGYVIGEENKSDNFDSLEWEIQRRKEDAILLVPRFKKMIELNKILYDEEHFVKVAPFLIEQQKTRSYSALRGEYRDVFASKWTVGYKKGRFFHTLVMEFDIIGDDIVIHRYKPTDGWLSKVNNTLEELQEKVNEFQSKEERERVKEEKRSKKEARNLLAKDFGIELE